MRNDKLNSQLLDIINNNNGLKIYLASLNRRVPTTDRSWLYETMEPEKVRDVWIHKYLQTLEHGNRFENEVFLFDTSSLEKWGPQGGHAPLSELLEEIVYPTFSNSEKPKIFDSEDWKRAKWFVSKELSSMTGGALRPASYDSVVDDLIARDVLESNSGFPLFTRRSKAEVKSNAISDALSGAWKEYPAIALIRYYRKKSRLVWMYPFSRNLVEGKFVQPLMRSLTAKRNIERSKFAPWYGFDAVRKLVSLVYSWGDESSGEYDVDIPTLAASDFKSTDATFTRWHTQQVFDVIKYCYQKQYWNELEESLMQMHEIPLVISDSEMVTGYHGVASGSNWTNFVETIFDLILGQYVNLISIGNGHFPGKKDWYVNGTDRVWHANCLYAIGDDMTWFCDWFNDKFPALLEEVGKQCGLIIQAAKTTNNPNQVKSLQRLFQRGYRRPDGEVRGVYSTLRALNSLLYPERFHNPKKWSSDMFCARTYMILENCVDHPLFEEFCTFVVGGNSHLIPFAKLSKSKLDRIWQQSKSLTGLNPTYNQEKLKLGLGSYASVEYISSRF